MFYYSYQQLQLPRGYVQERHSWFFFFWDPFHQKGGWNIYSKYYLTYLKLNKHDSDSFMCEV